MLEKVKKESTKARFLKALGMDHKCVISGIGEKDLVYFRKFCPHVEEGKETPVFSELFEDAFIFNDEFEAEKVMKKISEGYKMDSLEIMHIDKLDFSEALKLMKGGYKIAREGWNGKEQYVKCSDRILYDRGDGVFSFSSKQIAIFYGSSGVQVGWLVSQGDLFAEDWKVVGV